MPEFNPDEYLAEKKEPAFNPDEYLAADQPKKPMGWKEYLLRGATGTLPYLGTAGGAALGSMAANPVTPVVGGGLGYAAGKEAEHLANNALFGDQLPSTKPVDQLNRVVDNTATGAMWEMGGAAGGKALKAGADAMKTGGRFVRDKLPSVVGDLVRGDTVGKMVRQNIGNKVESGLESILGKSPKPAAPAAPMAPATTPKIDPFTKRPRASNSGVPKEEIIAKAAGSKFAGPLAKAAARGDESFGATYYLLSTSYPEFRELLDSKSEVG